MRAEFQVLVIPFIRKHNELRYIVFRRQDNDHWQFVSGGGEDYETTAMAMKRETRQEIGSINGTFYNLTTINMIPADMFVAHSHKTNLYTIPEYCFAIELKNVDEINLSDEHKEYKVVNYEEALELLVFESNKTALWELNKRILRKDLAERIHHRNNNYAFIDSQNMYLSIKNLGWKIDYKKLMTYLHDKYKVRKAFLFTGYLQENQNLYRMFQKFGYIVIFKQVLKTKSGMIKGNTDAEMVLNAMMEMDNYDRAVIVSGDGDFHCLVKYLLKLDKLERLLIPDKNSYSSLYRHLQKNISYLSDLESKLRL
ncbi:MAG: NYN domain-containing protein [Bacteroidales bacterium]